jgi:MoaA/NifB/PqqE/SkfB family radical SAM enzyme
MFDRNNVKILHLETSSVCNAACPMCPRELDIGFNKDTDAVSLSLKQIKEMFTESFIKQLESMFMCGNYGDPAAAPECLEIFEYFRSINPDITLGIHSNGSLRNTSWWSQLGKILSRSGDYGFFSVDGLSDTNHIYRVNTNFTKILENAEAFISAGGQAHWEYLVFEHNEHQVEEARQLASSMGFVNFREKVSRRFFLNIPYINPPKGEKYR